MQIIPIGEHLHEMSDAVFWEKYKKKCAEIFTQCAKY